MFWSSGRIVTIFLVVLLVVPMIEIGGSAVRISRSSPESRAPSPEVGAIRPPALVLDRPDRTTVASHGGIGEPREKDAPADTFGAIQVGSSSSGGWWNLTPTLVLQPPARTGAAIAFDSQGEQVLLFGGTNGSTFFGDTWRFAHGAWTRLSPSTSPSPRAFANLAYDPVDDLAILFGGRNASWAFNDTWTFANGNWTHEPTTVSPSSRSAAAMAFDPARNVTVLFGGENVTGSPLGDTWEFDGRNWTSRPSAGAPTARFEASLTSDPSLGGVLLFGGTAGGASSPSSETWKYANGSWQKLSPANSPSGRYGASSAIVPVDSVVLLFGGEGQNGSRYLDDLWEFQGNTWAPVVSAVQPDPRANASMTYDVADGYLLLVGGDAGGGAIAETWVFALPISVSPFASQLDTDPGVPIQFGSTVSGGVPPYLYDWRSSTGQGSPISLNPGWNASFPTSGPVVVTILVSDRVGATGSSNLTLVVELLPTIKVNSTSAQTDLGLPLQLAAVASGGVLPRVVFWSFGDGFTSGANPAIHRFEVAGNYTASATVRDALGRNSSVAVRVTVAPLPSASIGATPPTTVSGYPVNFSVAPIGGTGAITVSWTFGDGGTAFGAKATHTFSTAGPYVVAANLTDRVGGTTIVQWTENVTAPPAVAGPTFLGDLLGVTLTLGAAVVGGAALLLRRRHARNLESTEPSLETAGTAAEQLPDPEILAGGGQEDHQPERRE